MIAKVTEIADLSASVVSGLSFLHSSQLPTGEFSSYRFRDPYVASEREFDSSPFPTALIAYCLRFFGVPKAKEMIAKAAQFLFREMEAGGIWRYWTSQHQYHRNIPPDLDDIACASSILQLNGINFPDNRKLVLANRSSKGLFYTWIIPRFAIPRNFENFRVALKEALNPVSLYYFWKLTESEPEDVDGVVNANMLFYLGEGPETKNVIEYLIAVVQEGREESCDKWHLSRFNLYYAISRNIFAKMKGLEPLRDLLVERIVSAANDDGTIGGHLLDTALAVCSLLNLEVESPVLDRAIQAIVSAQTDTGAWPTLPLYYGGPKKYYGWGSEELTTAFCLEALVRYGQA